MGKLENPQMNLIIWQFIMGILKNMVVVEQNLLSLRKKMKKKKWKYFESRMFWLKDKYIFQLKSDNVTGVS